MGSAGFTERQGQYLAFIAQYEEVAGASPSEGDIAAYFGVSGPSAHQMMVTLERRGLITRLPRVARSVRLQVPRNVLPELGADSWEVPAGRLRRTSPSRAQTWTDFAVCLATAMAAGVPSLGKYAAVHWMAERLAGKLESFQESPEMIASAYEAVVRIAPKALRRQPRQVSGKAGRPRKPRATATPPERPKRARRPPPEGQGSLF